ncbi:hypothetical protein IJF81_07260 [bacterium]|nr:hypothetical protein [bacterium]
MSLDMNMNIASSKPVIREAQTMQNDGGGGNLGYMAQGEQSEKKNRQYLDESIFGKKQETDAFILEKDLENFDYDTGFSIGKFIKDIIKKVVNAISRK